MYITESHENRTSRICSDFVDFRCAGGEKSLNCKTYWLPTILPTTGPMVPTDCAVPRSMPGDDGAGLFEGRQRISKAVRKQVQLLLFPGTIWGWVQWFGRWIAVEGFVALFFFSKEIADANFDGFEDFLWILIIGKCSSFGFSTAIRTGILKQPITVITCFTFPIAQESLYFTHHQNFGLLVSYVCI